MNLIAMAAAAVVSTGAFAASTPAEPTVLLVHGACADSSGWNGVISILEKDGYPVVAIATPLRDLGGDSQDTSCEA